jgi:hypothetical protein
MRPKGGADRDGRTAEVIEAVLKEFGGVRRRQGAPS